jgi:hypothetical protein
MDLTQERHEPAVGDIYETSRDDVYQVLYIDDQMVLLRDSDEGRNGDNIHRMERRVNFTKEVDAGFFEHQPDSSLDMMDEAERDWTDVDLIGAKTAENLYDAECKTGLDIQQADDDELLEVSGVGMAGLQNLKEFTG